MQVFAERSIGSIENVILKGNGRLRSDDDRVQFLHLTLTNTEPHEYVVKDEETVTLVTGASKMNYGDYALMLDALVPSDQEREHNVTSPSMKIDGLQFVQPTITRSYIRVACEPAYADIMLEGVGKGAVLTESPNMLNNTFNADIDCRSFHYLDATLLASTKKNIAIENPRSITVHLLSRTQTDKLELSSVKWISVFSQSLPSLESLTKDALHVYVPKEPCQLRVALVGGNKLLAISEKSVWNNTRMVNLHEVSQLPNELSNVGIADIPLAYDRAKLLISTALRKKTDVEYKIMYDTTHVKLVASSKIKEAANNFVNGTWYACRHIVTAGVPTGFVVESLTNGPQLTTEIPVTSSVSYVYTYVYITPSINNISYASVPITVVRMSQVESALPANNTVVSPLIELLGRVNTQALYTFVPPRAAFSEPNPDADSGLRTIYYPSKDMNTYSKTVNVFTQNRSDTKKELPCIKLVIDEIPENNTITSLYVCSQSAVPEYLIDVADAEAGGNNPNSVTAYVPLSLVKSHIVVPFNKNTGRYFLPYLLTPTQRVVEVAQKFAREQIVFTSKRPGIWIAHYLGYGLITMGSTRENPIFFSSTLTVSKDRIVGLTDLWCFRPLHHTPRSILELPRSDYEEVRTRIHSGRIVSPITFGQLIPFSPSFSTSEKALQYSYNNRVQEPSNPNPQHLEYIDEVTNFVNTCMALNEYDHVTLTWSQLADQREQIRHEQERDIQNRLAEEQRARENAAEEEKNRIREQQLALDQEDQDHKDALDIDHNEDFGEEFHEFQDPDRSDDSFISSPSSDESDQSDEEPIHEVENHATHRRSSSHFNAHPIRPRHQHHTRKIFPGAKRTQLRLPIEFTPLLPSLESSPAPSPPSSPVLSSDPVINLPLQSLPPSPHSTTANSTFTSTSTFTFTRNDENENEDEDEAEYAVERYFLEGKGDYNKIFAQAISATQA